MIKQLRKTLGAQRLSDLGFDVPRGEITPRQAVALNQAQEELPSTSHLANADDKELPEIAENLSRSTDNFTVQLEGESSEDLPMRKLLVLDKQLRSIRGSLKVVAKNVQLEERIEQEKCKLEEIRNIPDYTDVQ